MILIINYFIKIKKFLEFYCKFLILFYFIFLNDNTFSNNFSLKKKNEFNVKDIFVEELYTDILENLKKMKEEKLDEASYQKLSPYCLNIFNNSNGNRKEFFVSFQSNTERFEKLK